MERKRRISGYQKTRRKGIRASEYQEPKPPDILVS
jgi:hypothetical protein